MNLTSAHQVWSKFAQETMSYSLIKTVTRNCQLYSETKAGLPNALVFYQLPQETYRHGQSGLLTYPVSTCVPFSWSPAHKHAHLLPALAHCPQ